MDRTNWKLLHLVSPTCGHPYIAINKMCKRNRGVSVSPSRRHGLMYKCYIEVWPNNTILCLQVGNIVLEVISNPVDCYGYPQKLFVSEPETAWHFDCKIVTNAWKDQSFINRESSLCSNVLTTVDAQTGRLIIVYCRWTGAPSGGLVYLSISFLPRTSRPPDIFMSI